MTANLRVRKMIKSEGNRRKVRLKQNSIDGSYTASKFLDA